MLTERITNTRATSACPSHLEGILKPITRVGASTGAGAVEPATPVWGSATDDGSFETFAPTPTAATAPGSDGRARSITVAPTVDNVGSSARARWLLLRRDCTSRHMGHTAIVRVCGNIRPHSTFRHARNELAQRRQYGWRSIKRLCRKSDKSTAVPH